MSWFNSAQCRHSYWLYSLCNNLEPSDLRLHSLQVCNIASHQSISSYMTSQVSFIWFLILIGTGIYNITFFPGIFRAFDPSRAILREWRDDISCSLMLKKSCIFLVFVRTKDYGLLSGVLLALTGCEALFAKFVANRNLFDDFLLIRYCL